MIKELEELLNRTERENIEFKKCEGKLSKDVWETYSAFANTSGGYIVLGVQEPIPYKYEVVGVKNYQKILDDLFNLAANPEKVSINLLNDKNVSVVEDDGKYVIVIFIPELSIIQKPLYLDKIISKAYIRKNSADYLITQDEYARFLRNATTNIDGELLDGYTIDDLDKDSVLLFKNIIHQRKPEGNYLEKDNEEFLKDMGVFRIDRSDGRKSKLTLAGLLFLGTDEAITSRLPHFHLDYLNKKGVIDSLRWRDRVSSGDLNYTNLNIFKFYNLVIEKLKATIEEPFDLDDKSVRKSSAELETMLREALVNMLVHADYLDSETPIRAEVHDFFYTFTNPGTMKIPKEQFFVGSLSEPRNNTLITYFKKIGAAEKEGGGGREIFDVTKRNKFRLPELEVTLKDTYLKLWVAELEDSYPEFSEDTRNVLLFIRENNSVTMRQIEDALGFTNYRVRKALNELVDAKLVDIVGEARARRYNWALSKLEAIAAVDSLKKILIASSLEH